MNKNHKWIIYQIIALIVFIVSYAVIHHYMDQTTLQPNNSNNIFMIGALVYFPISWIYITIYFQQKKQPKLMEHTIWRTLPVILTGVSLISMVAFIMLVTMGPLMEWFEQGSWIFYVFVTYATSLYYLFIVSMVYKFSESKHNVLHYSYAWALGIIVVITFVF